MKSFKDLEFKPHLAGDGLQARTEFPNGYGVSVVRFRLPYDFGYGSYTSNETEWEVAILKDGGLTYETPITDDVIGHQTAEQVNEIMKRVQELK